MKKHLLFAILIFLTSPIFSQQTINGSITHGGIERTYILYVPEIYSGDAPVPLVFNFHGLGSNSNEQMFYGDFRSIADTANFLVVHPLGTTFAGQAHFNVGGFTNGSTVDDVGFSVALIDSISAEYNISQERVYSTGMSNGGYMSFLLACQASDRFAAIASVTGSMTPETFDECDPQHPTPILQIHGTADAVVPYDGAAFSKSIDDVLAYWSDFNNCNDTPTTTAIDNTSTVDGSTAEHIVYADGDNGATTEHFKITNGGHTWAGAPIVIGVTNFDIDASEEIWKFFSRYDINGLLQPTNISELEKQHLKIYPNPTSSSVFVENNFQEQKNFEIFSSFGKKVGEGVLNGNQSEVDFSNYPAGIYLLKIEGWSLKVFKI